MTKESLDHFTAHLINGPTDPLVVKLQKWLYANGYYQALCLKYVIGSVAIFGKADEHSLRTIRECCNEMMSRSLPNLLDTLVRKNDSDTVAQFVADDIWRDGAPSRLLKGLMKENWNVVEGLAMTSLGILKNTGQNDEYYHWMLRQLPAERQYEMIRTREVALEEIDTIYDSVEDRLLLREIFLLARCSHNPDPEIRRVVAEKDTTLKESLGGCGIGSMLNGRCPDSIIGLTDDALCLISEFMDVETVVCVVPMVSRTWRRLYWRILMQDTRIHDLYLTDLSSNKLNEIHGIAPWKYCQQNGVNVLKHLGWWCIESGALGRATRNLKLMDGMKEYLGAVIKYKTLPTIGDSSTKYDAFIKLFERVCEFSGTEAKPTLGKPEFLTDEEYDQAVYHFVYEKRWELRLSESLMFDDMPRLFKIIKEDEEVMERLVSLYFFYNYTEASLALIGCGQTGKVPDKLARLIFSQSSLFKGLVEPRVVPCSEYYNSIVESCILPKVVRLYYDCGLLHQLLISLILFFKSTPEKIDMITESMTIRIEATSPGLQDIKPYLEEIQFEKRMASRGHCREDIAFVRGVMVRCGLL